MSARLVRRPAPSGSVNPPESSDKLPGLGPGLGGKLGVQNAHHPAAARQNNENTRLRSHWLPREESANPRPLRYLSNGQ